MLDQNAGMFCASAILRQPSPDCRTLRCSLAVRSLLLMSAESLHLQTQSQYILRRLCEVGLKRLMPNWWCEIRRFSTASTTLVANHSISPKLKGIYQIPAWNEIS